MRYETTHSIVNKISILVELYAKCENISCFVENTIYRDKEGRRYFGKKLNMEKLFIVKKVLTKKRFPDKRKMYNNRRQKTKFFYQCKNKWIRDVHYLYYYVIMEHLYNILNFNMPLDRVDLIELNSAYKMLKKKLLKRDGK